jgi:hypothetical protein
MVGILLESSFLLNLIGSQSPSSFIQLRGRRIQTEGTDDGQMQLKNPFLE